MKVRIVVNSSKLTGVGRVVDLADPIAKNYIDAGYCLPLEDEFFVIDEQLEGEINERTIERSDT